MTDYLSVDDVLGFNRHFIDADALRDFGLLESAVLRPQTSVGGVDAYPELHDKAAALLHSLARNHAFVDGNKRTAWAATLVFYALNGHQIDPGDQGNAVALLVDTAEGQLDVPTIAATLKSWTRDLDH